MVENTIAGVKRCRIVKDTFRNTKDDFSDLVMEVACALISCAWNVAMQSLCFCCTSCLLLLMPNNVYFCQCKPNCCSVPSQCDLVNRLALVGQNANLSSGLADGIADLSKLEGF